MAAEHHDRPLSDGDVEAVLLSCGFGAERPRTGAVILAFPDPLRIAWANRSAATLFETTDREEMQAQVFAGRGREGLGAAVARTVPDGTPHLERLRLIRGFRSRTLAVSIARAQLPDGRPVLVLATSSHENPGEAATDFVRPGLADVHATGPDVEADGAALARSETALPPANENDGDRFADLRRRLDSAAPTRLLWQTDQAHRLVRLAGGLPDLVGLGDPRALGRPFTELFDDIAGRRLQAELALAAPWRALRLPWPLREADACVAVTLGAVAVRDRHGIFDGFKGFGTIHADDLMPRSEAARRSPGASPEPIARVVVDGARPMVGTPAAEDHPEVAEPPVTLADGDDARDSHPADGAEPTPVPDGEQTPDAAVESAAAPPIAFSSKVVALRPYQTFPPAGAAAGAPAGGAPEPSADLPKPATPEDMPAADEPPAPAQDGVDLSLDERINFNEIGRALRGAEAPAALQAGALAALQALDEAVLVASADRLLYANPAFFALTGYPTLDAVHAVGGLPHLLGAAPASSGGDAPAESRVVTLAGLRGPLPVDGRMMPLVWDGAPARLLTVRLAADPALRLQALEGEIRRRDLDLVELHAILDHVAECVLTVDRHGRILTLNRAAQRLFGYSVTEAAGEPLAMLVGPDAQVAVIDLDSGPEERAAGVAVSGRTSGGTVTPLHLTWLPLSHGRSCVMLRDQAERSALRRRLAASEQRLDEALAGKPEFLAKISHEIRTPLNAILGFTEILLDERFGPIGNERYKAYLNDIHGSGTQVLDLVNDLVDLSKMEAGRTEMRPAPLDVNRVVSDCVSEVQTTAHRERVIVRLSLLPRLAPALVDEKALRQIVGHILANAIRFNEPGGQVIVSTAMDDSGAVAVRVRDTGMGMTEAEVATAMEPFRLSGTAQEGGSGFSLPLARALVEANGATMTIKSRKDDGTLVEVVLPSVAAEPMRMPAE